MWLKTHVSQQGLYRLVVLVSIVLSVGGIVIAACLTEPSDGGRGGAIAVAVAFFVLFVRRPYGARVYQALTKDLPKLREEIKNLREGKDRASTSVPDKLDDLKRQVTSIVSRLDVEADGQRNQNIALAWASCIGTLAWGFGDMIAKWLSRSS